MPDFSIITPVLNQVSTIEKCIESVASQNVDVEHIIIDGGSTDGTVDIIRKYEDKLALWVSQPDRGQSHAINKGLERASGTWFNWLNGDDQLTENALQTVLETAESNTEVLIGKCRHINQNGETIAEGSARIWESVEATLGNYSMGQPSVFYRTETVRELGGLNENLHYCMDMDLWFRYLIKNGQKYVKQVDDLLSRFLVHTEAKTQDIESTKLEKLQVYKALFELTELPEVLRSYFDEVPNMKGIYFKPSQRINWPSLHAHFAFDLLLNAYAERDWNKCKALFDIAKKDGRINMKDSVLWQGRLMRIQ